MNPLTIEQVLAVLAIGISTLAINPYAAFIFTIVFVAWQPVIDVDPLIMDIMFWPVVVFHYGLTLGITAYIKGRG